MKHVFLITGPPGIGKTTLLLETVNLLKKRGIKVGGMLSHEVRENGNRVGFEIVDLGSGKRGWLARVNQQTGPQIGKYRVNLRDLENVGAEAIAAAVNKCEIVAIDEIGPMELFSQKFRNAVKNALQSSMTTIAVVHWKAKDELIDCAKGMKGAEIFVVTSENRNRLCQQLAAKACNE